MTITKETLKSQSYIDQVTNQLSMVPNLSDEIRDAILDIVQDMQDRLHEEQEKAEELESVLTEIRHSVERCRFW